MANVEPESQLPWMNQLSQKEKIYYHNLFLLADADKDNYISQNEAVTFLRKSNISDQYLGEIWQFVNRNGRGKLNANAFAVTLRLVSLAQSGKAPNLMNLANTNEYALPQFSGIDVNSLSNIQNAPSSTSSLTASQPGTSPLTTDPSTWEITPVLRDQYMQSFRGIKQSVPGFINGEESVGFFSQSGLGQVDLSQIWLLSDADRDMKLNFDEFCIAMFLVHVKIHFKASLPSALPPGLAKTLRSGQVAPASPPGLVKSNPGVKSPSIYVSNPGVSGTSPLSSHPGTQWWTMTNEDRVNYGKLFVQLDPAGLGRVSGDAARTAFGQFGLSSEILSKIWVLSDIDRDMSLNSIEFCIAMILISAAKRGMEVPSSLPAGLIDHIKSPTATNPSAPPRGAHPTLLTALNTTIAQPAAPPKTHNRQGLPQPNAPPRTHTATGRPAQPGTPVNIFTTTSPTRTTPTQPINMLNTNTVPPNPTLMSSSAGNSASSLQMILEEQKRKHALMLQAQNNAVLMQQKEFQEKQQLQAMKTALLDLIHQQSIIVGKIRDGQKLNLSLATQLFEQHQKIERIKKIGLELQASAEFLTAREKMIEEKTALAKKQIDSMLALKKKQEAAMNAEQRKFQDAQNKLNQAVQEKTAQVVARDQMKQEVEQLKQQLFHQQLRKERYLIHLATMQEKEARQKRDAKINSLEKSLQARYQREDAVIVTLLRGQPLPTLPPDYDIASLFISSTPTEGFYVFQEPLFP